MRTLTSVATFFAVLFLPTSLGQHLFLAGGGLTNKSEFFWNKLIQFAGGKGQARIGVITAGRDDPEEASKELQKILTSYGARHVSWIPVSASMENSANDETAAGLVAKQSAIFIDDGDVHRLVRLLRKDDGTDTLVLSAMREKFQRGVISGSGAGAAILSGTPLPVSGNSYDTLVHGTKLHVEPTGGRKISKRFGGCSYLSSGLGFLRSWLVEPHFNDQSLHGRTIRLLLDTRSSLAPRALGLGIDQEMALAIYRAGTEQEYAEVLGNKGGITIINTSNAAYKSSPKLEISGVQLSFLTEDDKLILATDEILPATWKSDLNGEEWHVLAESSDDIFSADVSAEATRGNFNRVAKRLFDSSLSKRVTSVTHERSPTGFTVEMDRRNSSEAFHNDSPSTSQHLISYARLAVAIIQRTQP